MGETSDPILFTFTPYNGYDLPVGFVAFSLPLSWTSQATPATIAPSGAAVPVAFMFSPGIEESPTDDGVRVLDVRANSRSAANGGVTIRVQDFRLTSPLIDPQGKAVLQVVPGHSTSTVLKYVGLNGFDATAQLSCSDNIGPGITCELDKTTVAPGDPVTLTVLPW